MKKITIEYATANFQLSITGTPLSDKEDAIIDAGMKSIVERGVSSSAWKSFAKACKGEFKRDSVPFTPTNAAKLHEAACAELTKFLGMDLEVNVTEYVGTEGKAARKFMGERESDKANDLPSWLSRKAGYTGPTHGDDGEYHPDAVVATVKVMRAVREAQDAAFKAALA